MKLLFVVPLMTGIGGIQSSLLNLLRELGPDTHDVTLCVFGNYVADDTELPAWVQLEPGPKVLEYCLADFRASLRRYPVWELPALAAVKVVRRVLGYRRMLDAAVRGFRVPGHYDVAIAYANDIYADGSFVGGANDIVRRCVDADRKVAWIHNEATRHGLDPQRIQAAYAGFDEVVNVSAACKAIFDQLAPPGFGPRSGVVHNVTDIARTRALAAGQDPYGDDDVFRLVTVARLDNRQKRIDRVIDACVGLKAAGVRPFRWHVVGGGPDEATLRRAAHDRGVDDVLIFEGRRSNPFPYVSHAHVFALTSDYEAYPMVLGEALALGVPVVSTRYPAAAEIIDDGENGLLIEPSVDSLVATLTAVMRDPSILAGLRATIAARPMDNETPMRQFEAAITGVEERV